jgi:hypothetical protein
VELFYVIPTVRIVGLYSLRPFKHGNDPSHFHGTVIRTDGFRIGAKVYVFIATLSFVIGGSLA